jgi:hypothetical protein
LVHDSLKAVTQTVFFCPFGSLCLVLVFWLTTQKRCKSIESHGCGAPSLCEVCYDGVFGVEIMLVVSKSISQFLAVPALPEIDIAIVPIDDTRQQETTDHDDNGRSRFVVEPTLSILTTTPPPWMLLAPNRMVLSTRRSKTISVWKTSAMLFMFDWVCHDPNPKTRRKTTRRHSKDSLNFSLLWIMSFQTLLPRASTNPTIPCHQRRHVRWSVPKLPVHAPLFGLQRDVPIAAPDRTMKNIAIEGVHSQLGGGWLSKESPSNSQSKCTDDGKARSIIPDDDRDESTMSHCKFVDRMASPGVVVMVLGLQK